MIKRITDKLFVDYAFKYFNAHATEEDKKRDIIIQTLEGAYVEAGIWISIEGSPPRGSFVILHKNPVVIPIRPSFKRVKEIFQHNRRFHKKDEDLMAYLFSWLYQNKILGEQNQILKFGEEN